jgi:hypothetical protein
MSNASPGASTRRGGRGAAVGLGAVLASGAAAALILTGYRLPAGLAAAVAATLLLWDRPDPRDRLAVFARHLQDLLFEACVLVPLAWVERFADPRVAVLALLGMGAAFVATYERAKGQGLGYRGVEQWPYRAATDALLVLGLVTGWLEGALWAFLAVTVAAAGVRAYNVARQERLHRAEAADRA